jgi:hypothetical protein
LREFLKPFVTGPNRILPSTEENQDESGEKAVAKPKGEEGAVQSENPGLEVVHPHAAGIDVGNSAHYVAVRPDRDPEPVRRFACFTADLHRLVLKLDTYGLLNNSFQPHLKIRVLRTYWRQRAQQVSGAATCVQRMQKALTQMNLQLANVIE